MADERPYSYRPPQSYGSDESSEESYEDARYHFQWNVNEDYNNFGHQEQRDGDNTQGTYYVNLPDSRRQTVTYYVNGDSGYVAEVNYEGEAQFPQSGEYKQAQPSYNAPRRGYN